MQLAEESPMVGVIVSVYYLGCAIGAIIASFWAVSQLDDHFQSSRLSPAR